MLLSPGEPIIIPMVKPYKIPHDPGSRFASPSPPPQWYPPLASSDRSLAARSQLCRVTGRPSAPGVIFQGGRDMETHQSLEGLHLKVHTLPRIHPISVFTSPKVMSVAQDTFTSVGNFRA